MKTDLRERLIEATKCAGKSVCAFCRHHEEEKYPSATPGLDFQNITCKKQGANKEVGALHPTAGRIIRHYIDRVTGCKTACRYPLAINLNKGACEHYAPTRGHLLRGAVALLLLSRE